MDARKASTSSILTLIYFASNPLSSMSDSEHSPAPAPAPKKKPKKSPLAKEWKTPPEPDPAEPAKAGATVPSHETLDAFFDPDSGAYYRRNESGEYQKAAIGSIGRYLRKLGFSSKTAEGHALTEDREDIETDCTVECRPPYFGRSTGGKSSYYHRATSRRRGAGKPCGRCLKGYSVRSNAGISTPG